MAKAPTRGILNAPKVDRGTDVSFKQDIAMEKPAMDKSTYLVGDNVGLDPIKGAGSINPQRPKRSESVGKGSVRG